MKIKEVFLIISINLLIYNTLAQDKIKIDSLQKVFESKIHDTLKVEIYFKLAEEFYLSNPEEARNYCLKAQKLAKNIPFEKGEAIAFGWLAYLDEQEGKLEGALESYQKSLTVLEKVNDKKEAAVVLNNMGAIYKDLGKAEEAFDCYAKSLKIRRKMKDEAGTASTLNNIGFLFYNQGRIKEALQKYDESLKIEEKLKNLDGIAATLINIGSIYKDQEQFEEALTYFNRSLELNKKNKDKFSLVSTYSNIGSVFQKQKKYNLALENYKQSLQIAEEIKDKRGIAYANKNIGIIYENQKQSDKAEEFLQKALNSFIEIADKWGMSDTYYRLGNIYLAQSKIEKAELSANQAHTLAKELGYATEIKNSAELLSAIYRRQGKFQGALEMYELFITMRDSIQNKELKKTTIQNQMQHEYDKKEAIIKSEYEKEVNQQRWLIITVLGILLSVSLIGFLIFRSRRKIQKAYHQLEIANHEIIQQKEEITSQSEELKKVNQQLITLDQFKQNMTNMIVHDLKNPINALLNIAPPQKNDYNEQIQSHARQMQTLVLNILDVQKFEETQMKFDKSTISLEHLAEIALQQTQFLCKQKNISINKNLTPNNFVLVDSEIIIRVIVNLLSNAIKYSNYNQSIDIEILTKENQIILAIKDNGNGIPADKLDKVFDKFVQIEARASNSMRSTGLGLTFCKMAIEAHEGQIGVESGLGKGSIFWFSLPLAQVEDSIHPIHLDSSKAIFTDNLSENSLELSAEDKAFLSPYLAHFQQLEVYYTSDLEKLLQTIPFSANERLKNWENRLKDSIFTMNQGLYAQVLAEINI